MGRWRLVRRHRLAVVASHVIQYQYPFFRRLAAEPGPELTVFYCSRAGAEVYRDADMGTSLRWENFGNAVLEALAMETPVVLSRGVGLADDVVSANAGVVGLDEVPALLDDPPRRAEMGRNGRALVAPRFAWPRLAQEMEEAYCSIRSRR